MPVPILCHVCHEGRYAPREPGLYACRPCGNRTTAAAFPVQSDERLVVLAGVLQVLAVPDGHQVITPTRRCHAPHLGAGLALALRLSRTHPVYRRPEDIETAESLLATLDADDQGPWALSPNSWTSSPGPWTSATHCCPQLPGSTPTSTPKSGPPTPAAGPRTPTEPNHPTARISAGQGVSGPIKRSTYYGC